MENMGFEQMNRVLTRSLLLHGCLTGSTILNVPGNMFLSVKGRKDDNTYLLVVL
jgi:hypothetical protein